MKPLIRIVALLGLVTGNCLAQSYPQLSATVREYQLYGFLGAQARITQFPSTQGPLLPINTNASNGFDLNFALSGTTARARFSLAGAALRAEARCDASVSSSSLSTSSAAPVDIRLLSNHALTGVLRLTVVFSGSFASTDSATAWLADPSGGFQASIVASTVNVGPGTFTYDLPLSLSAGLAKNLRFGTTLVTQSGVTGAFSSAATVEFLSVQASYQARYASGCAGSAGQALLAPVGNPVIGSNFDLGVSGLPAAAVAIGLLGFQNLPTDLGSLGAPGCIVHTDVATMTPIANPGGSGTWTLAIPNLSLLRGLGFLQQVLVLDPTANALGVSLSHCGRGVFGD